MTAVVCGCMQRLAKHFLFALSHDKGLCQECAEEFAKTVLDPNRFFYLSHPELWGKVYSHPTKWPGGWISFSAELVRTAGGPDAFLAEWREEEP